jgi:hypothetical protein
LLEVFGGKDVGAGIVFDIVTDEIGSLVPRQDFFDVAEVGVGDVVVALAELVVGEETFLDALEVAEVAVEVGDGFAFAKGGEDAVLDEAEDGFEVVPRCFQWNRNSRLLWCG